MKKITLLVLLVTLAGCQITLAKLPEPAPLDVAEALKQHAQILDILAEDYKKRNPNKEKK